MDDKVGAQVRSYHQHALPSPVYLFELQLPQNTPLFFMPQVIKTFSMREGWWYIGIKGGGGVKSKGTRIVIEKEKRNRPILAACRHV